MDREAWIFFGVLITVQVVLLRAYGRVVRRWWELLPAPLPQDWIPFDGDSHVAGRPALDLGGGWLPVGLDPGAVWRITIVDDGTAAELLVLRRARYAPPAGPVTRYRLHPMAAHAATFTGLRSVPCRRTFSWVRANRPALARLRDEPDGLDRLLVELGVSPPSLLVTPPLSLADPVSPARRW